MFLRSRVPEWAATPVHTAVLPPAPSLQMLTPDRPESWSPWWFQATSFSCTSSTSCREATPPWRPPSSSASCPRLCFRSVEPVKALRALPSSNTSFVSDFVSHQSSAGLYFEKRPTLIIVQVVILLYVAGLMVQWLWKRGLDPDNFSIPYLTALGDLLGTGFLALSFKLVLMVSSTGTGVWQTRGCEPEWSAVSGLCKQLKTLPGFWKGKDEGGRGTFERFVLIFFFFQIFKF